MRDEVTGDWRKMHDEELHDTYSSPDILGAIKSRGMGWAGHVARAGDRRDACRVLVGKRDGRRLLEKLRHRCEDNIKMDIQERGWKACSGLFWLTTGTSNRMCEQGVP